MVINCVGIVLAGGESKRFGSPKALAQWNDKTFIELSIETLSPFTNTIFIVTRVELINLIKALRLDEIHMITDVDRFKGKGPLAGIYSAMIRKKADYYLISPCDMPFMKSIMYKKWLNIARVNEFDCVIPIVNGKVYPLNGVYHQACLSEIFSSLQNNNLKMMDLLNRKNTYYMEVTKEEEKFFVNVNTQEELKNIL